MSTERRPARTVLGQYKSYLCMHSTCLTKVTKRTMTGVTSIVATLFLKMYLLMFKIPGLSCPGLPAAQANIYNFTFSKVKEMEEAESVSLNLLQTSLKQSGKRGVLVTVD